MQVWFLNVNPNIRTLPQILLFENLLFLTTGFNIIAVWITKEGFVWGPNVHKPLHPMTTIFPPKMVCLKKKTRSWTMSKIILTFMSANIRLLFTCIHCLPCSKFWNLIKNRITKVQNKKKFFTKFLPTNTLNINIIYFFTHNPSKLEHVSTSLRSSSRSSSHQLNTYKTYLDVLN